MKTYQCALEKNQLKAFEELLKVFDGITVKSYQEIHYGPEEGDWYPLYELESDDSIKSKVFIKGFECESEEES